MTYWCFALKQNYQQWRRRLHYIQRRRTSSEDQRCKLRLRISCHGCLFSHHGHSISDGITDHTRGESRGTGCPPQSSDWVSSLSNIRRKSPLLRQPGSDQHVEDLLWSERGSFRETQRNKEWDPVLVWWKKHQKNRQHCWICTKVLKHGQFYAKITKQITEWLIKNNFLL